MQEKILMIDDDELLLRTFTTPIKKLHYDVYVASGGLEALRMITNVTFDIIFCDLRMPGGLDGFQTLEALRKAYVRTLMTPPPLVATTGYFEKGLEAKLVHFNIKHLLLKPYDMFEFMDLTHRVLKTPMPKIGGFEYFDPASKSQEGLTES